MELKVNEQQQAQNLYFQTDLSSAEIAAIVGVSARTVSRWISKEQWKRIKQAARHAPSAIIEKLYFQVNEINDAILSRPPGQRYATVQEADIIRKLTIAIEKLKQQVTLCESIDVMMRFTTHVAKKDLPLAKKITLEANDFMKGTSAGLHKPYELTYGSDEDDCLYEDDDEPITDNESQLVPQQPDTAEPAMVADTVAKPAVEDKAPLSSETIPDIPAKPLIIRKRSLPNFEVKRIIAQERAKRRAGSKRW